MSRLVFAALFYLILANAPARASEVYIGLEGSKSGAQWSIGLPPAVPEHAGDAEQARMGRQMLDVLRSDLLFTRQFRVVAPPSASAAADPKGQKQAWSGAGAGFVLVTKLGMAGGRVTISAGLLDLASGELILERYYRQDERFWRSAAHTVCDDVIKQLTGHSGIARTQVAFVNDQTGNKEVYVADYDGENIIRLTSDRSIDLLPRWSPDRKKLVYTSYKDTNPDLVELNLETRSSRLLSFYQGLNIAGGFSPDGQQLLLTLSKGKNPNLYVMDMADRKVRQLTTHFGVDASATYSPDGADAAFVSDRSGNPEVYILSMTTNRARRLTKLNWCDSPSWSPTGEWIVFSGRANNKDKMDIFLVDITGSQIRQVTHSEGSNEDPSWSPDGRFIAFTSNRDGRRRLYVMDSDGSAPHVIGDIAGNTSTPAWSPAP